MSFYAFDDKRPFLAPKRLARYTVLQGYRDVRINYFTLSIFAGQRRRLSSGTSDTSAILEFRPEHILSLIHI